MRMTVQSLPTSQRTVLLQPDRRSEDLDTLSELIDRGAVTPVVDRTFSMVETREAVEYLAGRRARDKVIITP